MVKRKKNPFLLNAYNFYSRRDNQKKYGRTQKAAWTELLINPLENPEHRLIGGQRKPEFCISNRFPGDVRAAASWTSL